MGRKERRMSDLIDRQAAIDASEKLITDCNPEHFVGHQKFIKFMGSAEIGSFGKWQFANGFNMGLTAAEVAIKKLPSEQPDVSDTDGDMISRKLMYDLGATCIARRDDDGKLIALGRIDMLPPVKHGKWIEKSTGGEHFACCSECGYVEWDTLHNYCPECGARMDAK